MKLQLYTILPVKRMLALQRKMLWQLVARLTKKSKLSERRESVSDL
jgi:hypothetical protein